MKKYFAMLLVLSMILCFASCNGTEQEDDGKALETADTYIAVENNGGSVDLNEDTAKTLLGIYTPQQLGLKNTIDNYRLVLSATKLEGKNGCKIEAFAEKTEAPEGVFMIVGNAHYVFDKAQNKYVPIAGKTSDKPSVGTTADETEGTTALNIPDDPEISFQYHKENNHLMRERFSKYDYKVLGLEKPLNEYVFIVNGTPATATDGETVYMVTVHEKNGDETGVKLAFSENGEYKRNAEKQVFEKIEAN